MILHSATHPCLRMASDLRRRGESASGAGVEISHPAAVADGEEPIRRPVKGQSLFLQGRHAAAGYHRVAGNGVGLSGFIRIGHGVPGHGDRGGVRDDLQLRQSTNGMLQTAVIVGELGVSGQLGPPGQNGHPMAGPGKIDGGPGAGLRRPPPETGSF